MENLIKTLNSIFFFSLRLELLCCLCRVVKRILILNELRLTLKAFQLSISFRFNNNKKKINLNLQQPLIEFPISFVRKK